MALAHSHKAMLLFALIVTACSDAGLQPLNNQEIVYYDNQLAVDGQFCASPADEVAFPVKILIVIDQSASLQCTDPGNNRLAALNLAGAELDQLPNVEFGVIGFASWSRITEFSSDWSQASAALAPQSGQGGPATDYQGALSTVLRVLEQDMLDVGAAMLARTKYMVLFLSDGVPEPRCRAGCDDGDTTPDSLYGVCNTSQDIPDGVYVDMLSACPEYNQPEQIVQKVQDIVALGDFYGAGDIQLNTIFLFAPDEDVAAVCGDVTQFGYVREEAEPLLRTMAEEGRGTFRDVNISNELDFLDFDYESLQAPYEMAEFFAVNMNAVASKSEILVDSDQDGLDDTWEFNNKLDRLEYDSDGDHFSDLFETRFSNKGYNALDEFTPVVPCTATLDRDADGLLECEELFLHTDPLLPDSDGDRIPDGIEFRFGTDPLVHDTLVDHDFDSTVSGNEIRAGTNPKLMDDDDVLMRKITYSITPGELIDDQERCYSFDISGITLVPTLSEQFEPKKRGQNQILIFAQESLRGVGVGLGRYHVACIYVRYLDETFKDPPSGKISNLHPSHFVEMQLFDPAQHCLGPDEDPSLPVNN